MLKYTFLGPKNRAPPIWRAKVSFIKMLNFLPILCFCVFFAQLCSLSSYHKNTQKSIHEDQYVTLKIFTFVLCSKNFHLDRLSRNDIFIPQDENQTDTHPHYNILMSDNSKNNHKHRYQLRVIQVQAIYFSWNCLTNGVQTSNDTRVKTRVKT